MTTNLQKIISWAIENGYRGETGKSSKRAILKTAEYLIAEELHKVLTDPAFYKCLGKKLGYFRKPNKNTCRDGAKMTDCGIEAKLRHNHWYCPRCERYEWDSNFQEMWKHKWHYLIDLIAEHGFKEGIEIWAENIIKEKKA